MKSKLKGGIETIIATIILSGIVIALIIGAVMPAVTQTTDLGEAGTDKIGEMRDLVSVDEY